MKKNNHSEINEAATGKISENGSEQKKDKADANQKAAGSIRKRSHLPDCGYSAPWRFCFLFSDSACMLQAVLIRKAM